MKIKILEYVGLHKLKNSWKSLLVLIAGLLITFIVAVITYRDYEQKAQEELNSISMEISLKIDARLHAHALILRAGSAFFAVSDTVIREKWKEFVERTRIDTNLPGVQGLGYALLIPRDKLQEHTEIVREEGFSNYSVHPPGERDFYTSIIYLEPFSGRNLRAFGYDMYSEPVRRTAMQLSCDNNVAMLSGKVGLMQETDEDIQSGTLMYIPDYNPSMAINTIEERRAAIRGWVYSPYRMRDLMDGILGQFGEDHSDKVRLQIYDDSLSAASLMYDSQVTGPLNDNPFRTRIKSLPVEFNGKKWILVLSQSDAIIFLHPILLVIFFSGIIISLLLYLLSLSYFKIAGRSRKIISQNKELQKLNATKDKFFSIIAHDLKSPFNSIIGFSKILIDQVEMQKYDGVARYAGIIHQSSNVAMELLTNLMEWSQSQTGRLEFNPERFNLKDLTGEVELLFIDLASHKSIKIKNDIPDPLIVYADYEMVGTILRNLISNALKFTHPGGEIIVSAKENLSEHIISVTDTGVGIPQERIGRLFRVDESYSTKGTQNEKGTGLGLILCREFVERHGGKIGVESQPKKTTDVHSTGSVFYFTLPFRNTGVDK
jgi:signal transduction histidine kinase